MLTSDIADKSEFTSNCSWQLALWLSVYLLLQKNMFLLHAVCPPLVAFPPQGVCPCDLTIDSCDFSYSQNMYCLMLWIQLAITWVHLVTLFSRVPPPPEWDRRGDWTDIWSYCGKRLGILTNGGENNGTEFREGFTLCWNCALIFVFKKKNSISIKITYEVSCKLFLSTILGFHEKESE